MGLALESMAIEMPAVVGHPNRAGFKGILTLVDVPSDKAPSGARGHRVVLTRRAAEAAIPSLLGMALDYAPGLEHHDTRRKVGVITRAEIVGRGLEVGGYLYARDFPEIVEEIGRAKALPTHSQNARMSGAPAKVPPKQSWGGAPAGLDGLGMSYEIAEAQVEDMRASVWVLNRVTFTGAAILRREKAAYRGTWIELSGE